MTDDLKDVKIILHQAHGTSTFQPSLLSGILEMCPSKPLLITEVRIKLVGEAFVKLGEIERREEFLDITQTIFPNADEPIKEGEITTLQEKARYALPFNFELMNHFPSSFVIDSTYCGIIAYVRYFVESIIVKPKNAFANKFRKEFKFLQTRNLSLIPEYTTPKLYHKSHRLGVFGQTAVHLDCELSRTAYYVGETIALTITVDNSERKFKTKFIMAQLVQDIDLIEKENEHPSLHKSSTIKVLQSIVVVDSIEAKKCEILNNVQLPIQSTELPPTTETRKSVLLNYAIVVKVIIDEKSKIALKIPILVAQRGI